MRISYKVLKKYIKDLPNPQVLADLLIMHVAEVEEIIYEGENLKDVYIGVVKTCKKHPDSDKLSCTIVEVNGENLSIVCGAPNVREGIKVPVAVVGARLGDDFVISKTKIRGETSEGMICSEDELGLIKERQKGILELPHDAPLGISLRDYLGKDDAILVIDNKAINHRPDLFSHIGIAREIEAIRGKKLDYLYVHKDFSNLAKLGIRNETDDCERYIGLRIDNVENIESPEYIRQVLNSAGVASKGLLIDITNYSLYLYGQPMHAFDADKIEGSIIIRFARDGEKLLALNDVEYTLTNEDIVIADEKKVLSIGGVIGGKESAVSDSTKNVILESANFNQATVRKTGKRLGIRTDALNVFEKDIVNALQIYGLSLAVDEIMKNIPEAKLVSYSDEYRIRSEEVFVPYDLDFMNRLIGEDYSSGDALKILHNLGFELEGDKIRVPFWRKDVNFKADLAEDISRIIGYDKIKSTLPELETKAITQDNNYRIKNDIKNFFTSIGYFDLFNYSFVNENLMNRCLGDTRDLVPIKNALSEELTHLRGSLIPNLLLGLEGNIRDYSTLKLFEIEKIFRLIGDNVQENYSLGGLKAYKGNIGYYDILNDVSNFMNYVGVYSVKYDQIKEIPSYAHPGRTASIIVRGQNIGYVGEIHPRVLNSFSIEGVIGFFEINTDLLLPMLYQIVKAKDISQYQENDFDLNFVVDKSVKASTILETIGKTDLLIKKVNLIDIYENEEKLPNKRSLVYKIYIQSSERTLDDNDKAKLINEIVKNVSAIGGELRS